MSLVGLFVSIQRRLFRLIIFLGGEAALSVGLLYLFGCLLMSEARCGAHSLRVLSRARTLPVRMNPPTPPLFSSSLTSSVSLSGDACLFYVKRVMHNRPAR